MPRPSSPDALRDCVRAALAEDVGTGDTTTLAVIEAGVRAVGLFVARERCVLAGVTAAIETLASVDRNVRVSEALEEGARVEAGTTVLRVEGPARAILTGERVALNFVQHLSGVATLTRRFVEAAGGRVQVLHTRKTTPGLRALECAAVEAGGGVRHRQGLDDGILLKENHFALSGRGYAATIAAARRFRAAGKLVGAEARTEEEARMALDGGVDYVLLDNFAPEALRGVVGRLRRAMESKGTNVLLEASGGIRLDTIAEFAASGVDRISCGALTHSAPSIDFSLDVIADHGAAPDPRCAGRTP